MEMESLGRGADMKNIVVVDIDGVLCDYRLGLLYWIRQSWPSLAQKANEHLKVDNTWIDNHSMEVSYREWLGVLEMFRLSGGKQSLPVFPGAKTLLDWCKKSDFEIVLLTSRPIDIYSNIYRDTVEWLRNNKLPYDMILWSKSKADMVYKMRLLDKVLWAFDDELRHVIDYAKLDIHTIWIDLYDSRKDVAFTNVERFVSLEEFCRKSCI